MNKTLFAIGLIIVLLSAVVLLASTIPFGVAAAIAVLGIGLILVSRQGRYTPQKSKPEEQVMHTIFSTDKNFRAVIKQRLDGKFQVETWKLDMGTPTEYGQNWIRQGAWGITDTLSDAVDMAENYIGAGGR